MYVRCKQIWTLAKTDELWQPISYMSFVLSVTILNTQQFGILQDFSNREINLNEQKSLFHTVIHAKTQKFYVLKRKTQQAQHSHMFKRV